MDRSIQLRGDQLAVLWLYPRWEGPGVHDARHLDFELNSAILVEIPEIGILVVADGGDKRDDQAPRAAHLCLVRTPIDMLPQDAVVLFVHTDGIGQFHQVAAAVS